MSSLLSKISLLDDLLIRIGENLQLNKTRRERAEQSYKSVAKWLLDDKEFFHRYNLNIYPQGSYRLGTTVKPKNRIEYDLDFVLEVDCDYRSLSPTNLLNHVERRLRENNDYIGKIERKKRCICINYEGDFHLDIIPALPKYHFGDKDIKICDRKLMEWLDSSPKGYVEWFESKFLPDKILLEKAASIEFLPGEIPYSHVQTIQKVVQLIKRRRDLYFENLDVNFAPRSIVLTTLSGYFYNASESESSSLMHILNSIKSAINASSGPIKIVNPANEKEIFSDIWVEKPSLYIHFKKFIEDFNKEWQNLLVAQGIPNIQRQLEKMFGEDLSKQVITEQSEFIEELRKHNMLGVTTTGALVTSSTPIINIPIQKNTFYGEISKT